jgi:hypothetical protein
MVYVSREEGGLECRRLSSERVLSSACLNARRSDRCRARCPDLARRASLGESVQRDVWDAGRHARATCCTAADAGGGRLGYNLRTLSVVYGTSRAAASKPVRLPTVKQACRVVLTAVQWRKVEAGAVMDQKTGVQHVFVSSGSHEGGAVVFHISRTLNIPRRRGKPSDVVVIVQHVVKRSSMNHLSRRGYAHAIV